MCGLGEGDGGTLQGDVKVNVTVMTGQESSWLTLTKHQHQV